MPAPGTVWDTNTWDVDAWAADTWGTALVASAGNLFNALRYYMAIRFYSRRGR